MRLPCTRSSMAAGCGYCEFDHGVTSAGFSLDPDVHPIRSGESPEAEWRRLVSRPPSLATQFASAVQLRPFVRTGRLQRRLTRAAGTDWALLPHAAGFLDAWLSPGIAQTLFAVEHSGGSYLMIGADQPQRGETRALQRFDIARVGMDGSDHRKLFRLFRPL